MNLVTYNLRSGGTGLVHWAKILNEFRPGLFFVQETVAPEDHLPLQVHADVAGRVAWSSVEGRRWGSAIHSSMGETRPIELPDFRGHVIGMEIVGVEWPDGSHAPIRAFSVHAPARGSYQKAVNQILDMIASHSGVCDFVIGGDFNLTISTRNDGEARKTNAADLAIQARLKDEFGLVNCWREANPGLPLAQTLRWSNAPETPYHCDGCSSPVRGRAASAPARSSRPQNGTGSATTTRSWPGSGRGAMPVRVDRPRAGYPAGRSPGRTASEVHLDHASVGRYQDSARHRRWFVTHIKVIPSTESTLRPPS